MTTGDFLLDGNGNKFWDLGNMGGSQGVPNRPSGGFAGRHALAENTLNELNFRRTVASARNFIEFSYKDFKFTNNVAVDFQNQTDASYENTLVGDGAPGGRSSRETGSVTGLTLNQLLSYGKKFKDHRVDVLVGHESFNLLESGQRGFKQGQSLTGNTELNNFTTINAATSYLDRYRVESYLRGLLMISEANILFQEVSAEMVIHALLLNQDGDRFGLLAEDGTLTKKISLKM